ncbi:YqaJ viral recombinase family protein [Anaerococcus hydrogenalis]|uniref:YqaJ viral recombinase family protein n=1 Tax=Anaerococcus hydrogenalis ACS-025-V-Sch4 TaxID=879306 RepID=F0H2F6_9FIRM|nr:YqaJ viral recombinase family protein [Anaerococcus hydrogenalis]EGC83442.1 YqaJ viral recombinase family protein [Anaerococcus hydrogenalis ACS-025-V-Sch4]
MKNIANITKLTREEWLELRRKGIGGSDCAAACGLNPWKSKAQLFFEKTGQIDSSLEDNEILRQGRDLEEYVAKRFCEATGKKVRRNNFMMVDNEYPFMIADIDREVVGEKAILECKTTSPYGKSNWEDGKIPIQYELQCHHYMAVTGAEKCYIACLIFSTDFIIREIERDEEIIDMIRKQEGEFWNDYVLANEVPAPDGTNLYDDSLKKRFKGGIEETKTIEIGNDTFKDYKERKDLIKKLEKQNKEIEQAIKLQMEDFNYGENEFLTVSFKPYTSNRFDSKKFKEDEPELYKKYVKQSEGRRFYLKEKVND